MPVCERAYGSQGQLQVVEVFRKCQASPPSNMSQYLFACTYACVAHVCLVHTRPEEGIGYPATGVTVEAAYGS